MLNSDEGNKIKRILAIDGKTQRGNGGKNQKANHIVIAVDEKRLCLGQKRVEEATRAVRGHWMAEGYHWHLDVTFRKDGNHMAEKQAAYNLNIMRKLSLNN